STEKRGIHQVMIHHVEYDKNLEAARNCPMRIINIIE
ncbi:MAG TPA: ferredoxin, partial [Cytophagales bacterium]|nr:ferredoxin [Cytophagales bacterium]